MREFKSRTPYQFNGTRRPVIASFNIASFTYAMSLWTNYRVPTVCGDYSLVRSKRLSVQQEIESSNLSSHPRFKGASGKSGSSQLILDQSCINSNPVRAASTFNPGPWPRGEALARQAR
jgi:hypothetical protein